MQRRAGGAGSWRDDSGVTVIEFGLLIALIAVVVASSAMLVGASLADVFDSAQSHITGTDGGGLPQGSGGGGGGGNPGGPPDTKGWGGGSGGGKGHKG